MRVIGGKFRGIALRGGKGPQFRPTAQVVKGSVFDTLYSEIQDAVVLDLFAGSGALGIEALSRGAAKAVFVEQDPTILKALRTNLQRCGIGDDRAAVHRADAVRFLERTVRSGISYDIILADPPYASKLGERLARILDEGEREVCRMFIVETGSELGLGDAKRLEVVRTRKFGQTFVTYVRYREPGA